MRNLTVFLIFIIPVFSFSQKEFLDFVIDKNNDTIYGTIRNWGSKKSALYEIKPNPEIVKIKFNIHKLNRYKKIRYNDEIYTYVNPLEDGIYSTKTTRVIPKDSIAKSSGNFMLFEKRLPDFVVTYAYDTIFGKIEDPLFGKLSLFDSSNSKVNIDKENIKAFRYNNDYYEHVEKSRVTLFDKKDAYLKLILDGEVKLYEYEYHYIQTKLNTEQPLRSNIFYFLEKDKNLILVNKLLYLKKLTQIFSENQVLVTKILNKEYTNENIYLIVKYFNEKK